MLADCIAVWDNFKNFIGGRAGIFHWLLFCTAMLAVLLSGKRDRRLMFWPTVIVLLFFFNPFFYRFVGSRFLSGVYWRLMWMAPVGIITAYAAVRAVCRPNSCFLRAAAGALVIICVIVTGERMYQQKTFQKAENIYKLPQAALDVSDAIAAAGVNWKARSVVPNELLCYVRQYRCDIGLFYGRNAGGFISDIGEDEKRVYEEMCKEEPDIETVTQLCRKNEVIFICFNRNTHRIPDELDGYGYEHYRDVGDYRIFIKS